MKVCNKCKKEETPDEQLHEVKMNDEVIHLCQKHFVNVYKEATGKEPFTMIFENI